MNIFASELLKNILNLFKDIQNSAWDDELLELIEQILIFSTFLNSFKFDQHIIRYKNNIARAA